MMGVLGGMRADRLINQVVSSGSLETQASAQALGKLRQLSRTSVPKIIELLGTTRREETELVVELLIRLLDKTNLAHYCEGLTHDDQRVVAGVVRVLKDTRNLDPNQLLRLFDNPRASKPALLEVLSAHSARLDAEALLRQAYKLEHNDQAALFRIVEAVADEGLIPELVNRIDAQDPLMRALIARVLAKFPKREAQSALQRLLHDEHKAVRLAALEGLSRMDASMDVAQLCRLIQDPDMNVQSKAIDAIVKLNHPHTVRYLLEPLQDDSEYPRRAAVEVLNEIGNVNAIKDLLIAIKDRDWWVRSRAADALGRIGGARVVEAVIELIRDDDEFVRRTAIEIINATKNPRAYDSLIQGLGDTDWWVRERAIDGLAELGDKRAAPVLIKMLERADTDDSTAVVLIRGLSQLATGAAVQAVVKRLKVGSEAVKRAAIEALGAMCDERHAAVILNALRECNSDPDPQIGQLAGAAVERIQAASETHCEHPSGLRSGQRLGVHGATTRVGTRPASALSMPGTVVQSLAAKSAEDFDPFLLRADDVVAERYRFIRQVGRGAFGAVFLMEDLMVKEEIILKFLNADMASDEASLKRFVYELRFARKITHPNVIRIFDMINFGKRSAIAMEYFPSHTLGAETRGDKPMSLERALMVLSAVCEGMQAAHRANVIHRDLKPNNILINDASVLKIVDFGVAAATRELETRLTRTGLLVGTPTYMAPEQVLGRSLDARTDIYSLGVIMYEMLTGRPPYRGGDSMAVMYQHVQGDPQPPRAMNPQLPHTLSALVLKTMAGDPDKRFQSMAELGARLAAFATA